MVKVQNGRVKAKVCQERIPIAKLYQIGLGALEFKSNLKEVELRLNENKLTTQAYLLIWVDEEVSFHKVSAFFEFS